MNTLMDRASAALSMEPAEIVHVTESAVGLVAVTKDNNAMVINDDQDPAVQFLVPPTASYKGSFPVLFADLGPLPTPTDDDDDPAATLAASLAEVLAGPADDPDPEITTSGGDDGEDGSGSLDLTASVNEILAAIGDDAALAAEVLATETAAARPRKTLVAGLEAIVAGPDADAATETTTDDDGED